ncbi:hypothetical protein L210DRAFT_3612169 [Boletus edulis BED1]|uniref:RRM domain-containing protein n=1 Tax=Boletus edulis BED1 TaxID=1328754 RepID=A0AAD4BVE5_BOLED|nr:hypothetical protein L210DRAFT_3612169 [Boletus edulis BED1]
MTSVVIMVSGISASTTETEIKSIEHKDDGEKSKKAVITFEKPSAARTALMLNGGNLGGNTLTVTSEVEHPAHQDDVEEHHHPQTHVEQSDKPRAGIAAEYLAHGHMLTDDILRRAIDIDNKNGISKKFLSFMSGLDKSVGQKALGPEQTVSGKLQTTLKEAHTRVKTIDEQKGYSKVAREYYAKALASPLGQSVLSFYTSTSKQVRDIHEESLRIKASKTEAAKTEAAKAEAAKTASTSNSPPAPAQPESSK